MGAPLTTVNFVSAVPSVNDEYQSGQSDYSRYRIDEGITLMFPSFGIFSERNSK